MSYRYTIPMRPEFASKRSREETIGAPIRERLDDAVLEGIVVDWIDLGDRIELVVEVEDGE